MILVYTIAHGCDTIILTKGVELGAKGCIFACVNTCPVCHAAVENKVDEVFLHVVCTLAGQTLMACRVLSKGGAVDRECDRWVRLIASTKNMHVTAGRRRGVAERAAVVVEA